MKRRRRKRRRSKSVYEALTRKNSESWRSRTRNEPPPRLCSHLLRVSFLQHGAAAADFRLVGSVGKQFYCFDSGSFDQNSALLLIVDSFRAGWRSQAEPGSVRGDALLLAPLSPVRGSGPGSRSSRTYQRRDKATPSPETAGCVPGMWILDRHVSLIASQNLCVWVWIISFRGWRSPRSESGPVR